MSEINIARQLVAARHKKKITQEELASYIGVSKAAVSKWESGISFPDITLLPQLATYYNISIDELMGYEPQMTKEEIRRTYHELKKMFAGKSWEEASVICEEMEKKYYSCSPFLLQMLVLYLNHAMLAKEPKEVYAHCIELAERIRGLSEDVNDVKEAANLQVMCYLMNGESMKALDMMDKDIRPMFQDTELLAQIYHSLGNQEKAKEVYQISMYQHLMFFLSDMSVFLILYQDDEKRAEGIIQRARTMMDAFEIDHLHPNTAAIFYMTAAQFYMKHKNTETALEFLEKYEYVCTNCFFPYELHGDQFFDRLDDWFKDFDLGVQAPRSESLIQKSMITAIEDNPIFAELHKNPNYKSILSRLKKVN